MANYTHASTRKPCSGRFLMLSLSSSSSSSSSLKDPIYTIIVIIIIIIIITIKTYNAPFPCKYDQNRVTLKENKS